MPVDASHTDPEADRWNYRPEGQVGLNPLFSWPPNFAGAVRWYRGAWLELTALSVPFLVAVAIYLWFLPPLEQMANFQIGWVFTIWLLNIVPQTLLAGTLHWWLYMRKSQGMHKKFDKRDLTRDNGTFTFNNQVWDNIWWTLGSAMTVATIYQCVIFWVMANGWVPTITYQSSPIWFVILLFLFQCGAACIFTGFIGWSITPGFINTYMLCITAT